MFNKHTHAHIDMTYYKNPKICSHGDIEDGYCKICNTHYSEFDD